MSIAKKQNIFLGSKLNEELGSTNDVLYNAKLEDKLTRALNKVANLWTKQMRKNLDDFRDSKGHGKKTGSDVLRNSIKGYAESYESTVSLKIEIEDYYINVNDGRKGTKQSWKDNPNFMIGKRKDKAKAPPFEAINNWAKSKPLKLELKSKVIGPQKLRTKLKRTSVRDKVKRVNAIHAIMWSIKRKGIEPTYFYSQVINDESIKGLSEYVKKTMGKILIIDIKRYNNGSYNS